MPDFSAADYARACAAIDALSDRECRGLLARLAWYPGLAVAIADTAEHVIARGMAATEDAAAAGQRVHTRDQIHGTL